MSKLWAFEIEGSGQQALLIEKENNRFFRLDYTKRLKAESILIERLAHLERRWLVAANGNPDIEGIE